MLRGTVRTLIAAYKQVQPEGHWFDANSMQFFDSRIGQAHQVGDVWLFVTSEQFHGSEGVSESRKYTVRRMNEDGDISNVGKFQAYTRNTVRAALKQAIKAEEAGKAVSA